MKRISQLDPGKAWRSEAGIAHRQFSELTKEITRTTVTGDRMQPKVRSFFGNRHVKLSAALKTIGGSPERSEAIRLRDCIYPRSSESIIVQWYPKRKPNGTSRPVCNLPDELFALHKMIAAVLKATLVPHECLYGISEESIDDNDTNRSRDSATLKVQELIRSGFTQLVEVDIVNCFQSINLDALCELPLPKEGILKFIDTREMTFKRMGNGCNNSAFSTYEDGVSDNPSGPRGLMQGSPASNVIFAWFMNGLLNSLPPREDVKILICFDNIVVAGRDLVGCQAMVETLTDLLRRCSFGPLEMCPPIISNLEGFDFMSYHIDIIDGRIGVSERALEKLKVRLGPAEINDLDKERNFPIATWRTLRSFSNVFGATDDISSELSMHLESSASMVETSGNPMLIHLHENIFSRKGTLENEVLNFLLRPPK